MKEKGIFGVPVIDPITKRPITIVNMFNYASYFIDNEAAASDSDILGNMSTEELMSMARSVTCTHF